MLKKNSCAHQKVRKKKICSEFEIDFLEHLCFKKKIVTCIETCVFHHVADTKH
jgi:hypothetical protein